ncbi:PilN domain-containing protein [Roseateles sp. NT4]|uniref:PilN domain-containing protein n=1 Tax=Roseateles sp. NT4 TaxID=3453715 RepID=UPI003EEF504A
MAQQINLLTPILLAPKRYFSALTLLQASGLLIVAGFVAALWMQQRDRNAEAEHQALLARYATERQALTVARAGLPAPLDPAAVQQQLLPLQAGNAERRALLRTLGADGLPGQRHSDLLALVANSLPEQAWLSELRYTPGRLEISGGTLDTAVLRPWLARLGTHPLLAGQELAALRVDRAGAPGSELSNHPLMARGAPLEKAGLPVWVFRVVSAPAAPASAASGSAR